MGLIKPDFFSRVGVALGTLAFILLFLANGYSTSSIHHWTLDNSGGLTDKVGSWDLTNNGATSGASGVFGEAYDFEFDDTTDSLYSSATGISGSWTLCAWQKSESIPSSTVAVAVLETADSNDYYIEGSLEVKSTGNVVDWTTDGSNFAGGVGTTTISTGTWYHHCISWNSSSTTFTQWLNGSVEKTDNSLSSINTNIDTMRIGNRYSNAASKLPWDGLVDEVWIFDDALTSTEIGNLMNYNNINGVCSPSFTPTYAPINESQTFDGTNSCNVSNWYWFFTRALNNITYFTGTSNPTTQTLNYTGVWNVTLITNVSGTNYTTHQNVTVTERPTANFTWTPLSGIFIGDTIQFNDTSTDNGGYTPMSAWYWDLGDGTNSTTQNATHSYSTPNEYTVGLTVNNSVGVGSVETRKNITVNGFALSVFDETTGSSINKWNVTISNTTYSKTFTNQNNTMTWSNFSDFPTGSITMTVSASSHHARTYYSRYEEGWYINFKAYLLDSTSGVYPIFNVVDSGINPIENALVSAYRTINTTTYLIAQKYTDSVGEAQIYLSPSASYNIIVTHNGYEPSSNTINPTTREYIITLSQTTSGYDYIYANDSFFIIIQPYSEQLNETTDNITVTIHDPTLNLLYWNITLLSNGTTLTTYNSTSSGGGVWTINASTLGITAGNKVYIKIEYDRNGSSFYNFSNTWNTYANWSNRTLAGVLNQGMGLTEPQKNLVASVSIIIMALASGSIFGSGIGLLSTLALSSIFAWGGWLKPELIGIAILFALAGYVWNGKGGAR